MDLKFTNTQDYMTGKSIDSDFRRWCMEMWYQHCDEVESATGKQVEYGSAVYFMKYKYWLKREYQHQRINND